ncbi:unnamed protein product [Heligmosomoides polygyrus]|uniref:RING-type domain-containing protein n=1 Tax=Heligmosomoides polygyrus TaxID=6339 RepID=A0A183FN09_HELPZ|nr:unnamed protein product [Heligmosomoides polygyrus]
MDFLNLRRSTARPIRQVVEVSGRRESTYSVISSAEKANDERIQCCICIFNEKTVFLRPCNHICLCEGCFRAVMNEDLPRCPICRATIESHINVFL